MKADQTSNFIGKIFTGVVKMAQIGAISNFRIKDIIKLMSIILILTPLHSQAQTTTITTEAGSNFTGNNGVGGSSAVTFVIENSNSYPILLTDVDVYWRTTNSGTTPTLWYTSTDMSGQPNISAPDWDDIVTAPAVTVTTDDYYSTFSNMTFTIHANTAYRFAVESTNGIRYSGTAGPPAPNNFTDGGVTLYVYDHQINAQDIGHGGNMPNPGNNPRAFTGRIHFQPALPCVDPPTAGTVVTNTPAACPGIPFELNIDGGSFGIGQTYQWQTSSTGATGTWSDMTGDTLASLTHTQFQTNWYRAYVTCGNGVDTTNAIEIVTTGSPMSGTISIDQSQPASSTNFHSFSSLIDELQCLGIDGPLTVNIAEGTYNEQIVFDDFPGLSATNRIDFVGTNPDNTILSFEQNVSSERYTVRFNNTSHIGFQNITIRAEDAGTYGWTVHVYNQANDLSFENVRFITEITGSTFNLGMVVSGSETGYATAVSGTVSNISINNSYFEGGWAGVRMNGSTSQDITGVQITNSEFNTVDRNGIYFSRVADFDIINNLIDINPAGNDLGAGVWLTNCNAFEISTNYVHNAGRYGFYNTNTGGTSGNRALYANNVVTPVRNNGTLSGGIRILNGSSEYIDIVYNSFLLDQDDNRAFNISNTTPGNIRLWNNSFVFGGTGSGYAMYVSSEASIEEINYNNYYSFGTDFVYYGTDRADLSALQAVNIPAANDDASVSGDPIYSSSDNLLPLGPTLDGAGTPLTFVTTDITGATRSTPPDIGAYEFTPPTGDVAVISAELLTGECPGTNDTIQATIHNVIGPAIDFGIDPLTFVYNIDGPVSDHDSVVLNVGTLGSGQSLTVQLPGIDMSETGTYTLTGYIRPNAVNQVAENDTLDEPFVLTIPPVLWVTPDFAEITSLDDTIDLTASSEFLPSGDFFMTEISHWRGATTGSPTTWPPYMLADDYIEITGIPNADLGGITLEQWSTTGLTSTHTFPAGTVLSPNGTAIIAVGQLGSSVPSPADFYYHGNGAFTGLFSSTESIGRILRDAGGIIIDAAGYPGSTTYTFPAAAGVTPADWSGNPPAATSTAGIRLEGPYTKDATNWIVSSSTNPQDPNSVNQGVTIPSPQPATGLQWSLNGTPLDTTQILRVSYTSQGIHEYVITYNSPCGTFSDTAIVVMPALIDMEANGIDMPAPEACENEAYPVNALISNASVLAALDFTQDPATITIDVSGAATQSFTTTVNDNNLNGGQPLETGHQLLVPVDTLNLTMTGTYYFATTVTVAGDGNTDNIQAFDTLEVNISPVVDAGNDQFICAGTSVNLSGSATNGTSFTYDWSPGIGMSDSTVTDPVITLNESTTFTLVATNEFSCSSAGEITVHVSDVTADAGTDSPVCSGIPVVIGGTSSGGFGILNYSWSPSAPLNDATAANPEATIFSDTGFELIVTDSLGCSDIDSVYLTALSDPEPEISGPQTVCINDVATYSTTFASGNTYQWNVTGGIVQGSSTDNTIEVLWNNAGSGSLNVTQTITAGGCDSTTTDYMVTINPLPAAEVSLSSASAEICLGDTANVSVTFPEAGAAYQWRKDGTVLPDDTMATIYVTETGGYDVIATSQTGCIDTSSAPVNITVNPLPQATVTPDGPTTFCEGEDVLLSANTGTGLSYQWSLDEVTISGANNAAYLADLNGDYSVEVTDSNGCMAISSAETVTVNPVPAPSAMAHDATTFCDGNSVMLSVDDTTTGITYQWRIDNTDISGATNHTYNATASGMYDVVVTNVYGCSEASNEISVDVLPLPQANITPSGSTTFCEGDEVTLQADTDTGVTYLWFESGMPLAGASNDHYVATQSGDYTVEVTNNNTGCVNTSEAVTVTVNDNPDVNLTADGPSEVCAPGVVHLDAGSSGTVTHQWYRNDTSIAGEIMPTHNASISGSYHVIVTQANTGCTSASATIDVTVNPKPVAGISAAGPVQFCEGGSVELNADMHPDFIYSWLLDGQVVAGENAANHLATVAGEYQVAVSYATGCSDTSSAINVTIDESPVADFTAMDQQCEDVTVTFVNSSSISSGDLTYHWLLGDGNTSQDESPAHIYAEGGTYDVSLIAVSNVTGCADSTGHQVEVYTLPSAEFDAVVNPANTSVTVTPAEKFHNEYMWDFGDGNSSTETVPAEHVYTANGAYNVSLLVTSNEGCINEHDTTVDITTVSVEAYNAAGSNISLSAYPNPFSNQTQIEYTLHTDANVSLEVYNLLGQKVEDLVVNEHQSANTYLYTFSSEDTDLLDGIYLIRLTVDNKALTRKVSFSK